MKNKKTICLNMIVKNETKTLPRLLRSVRKIISTYVIVDTGSTDGTPDLIKKIMTGYQIEGTVYERPWVNFGVNRQLALELAVDTADYIMIIDADEEIIDNDFNYELLDKNCYSITRKYSSVKYELPFLVSIEKNNDLGWKWNAPVHNYLTAEKAFTSTSIDENKSYIHSYVHEGAKSQGKSQHEKYKEDAELLLKEVQEKPNDSRSVFYLAQSYKDAKTNVEAIKYYLRRTLMGGWSEEVFYSYLQLGLLHLEENVDLAERYFLTAAQTNPQRTPEACYFLTRYFRLKKENKKAIFWGMAAITYCLKEIEIKNKLFIDPSIYEWRLADELSLALHSNQEVQLAKDMMQKVLLVAPPGEQSRLQKNLTFC